MSDKLDKIVFTDGDGDCLSCIPQNMIGTTVLLVRVRQDESVSGMYLSVADAKSLRDFIDKFVEEST